MIVSRCAVAVAALALACASPAAETENCGTHSEREPKLCTYEPNTIGYTQDSDDVGFMDFKISVRYQLFPDWLTRGLNNIATGVGDDTELFFAFTGRFGQYIGTRDSSPVIGKRFNPKLFVRYWTTRRDSDERYSDYVDFAFLAHESNGQSIDSPAGYQAAQAALLAQGQNPEFANDHISRGWDYLELVWKALPHYDRGRSSLTTYVNLKYFLDYGLLQGRAEEYNVWENDPEGKPRNQVSGVAGMLKYIINGKWLHFGEGERRWYLLNDVKLVLAYETGYKEIFQYNTVRLEAGTKFMQLPLNLWAQKGYNSDLAQYYKKVSSWGIEVQIGSF